TISVPVIGDTIPEQNEQFLVNLTGIANWNGPPANFAAHVDLDTGTQPCSVAEGDLNGDGKPDFAVANRGTNNVSIFLNNTPAGASAPTFAPKVDYPTGNAPISIAIGDLNGDGKPDFAITDFGSNQVSVLLNTTTIGAMTPTFTDHADFS